MKFLQKLLILLGIFSSNTVVWPMTIEQDMTRACDPLWWANSPLPYVEYLVEIWGEDTILSTLCDEQENTFLHLAVMESPYPEVVDYLLMLGFSTEDQNLLGQDAVSLAHFNENLEILYTVLAYPPNTEEHPQEYANLQPENHQPLINSIEEDSSIYFGIAGGTNLFSTMTQQGWNKDRVCYPNHPCFEGSTLPVSGYQWSYNVQPDSGGAVEAFVGYKPPDDKLRIEVAFGRQTTNQIDQQFQQVEDLNGTAHPMENSDYQTNVVSHPTSHIGNLSINTFSFNGYYDFLRDQKVVPYIGYGVSFARIQINDIYFSINYEDPTGLTDYNPPLAFYSSEKNSHVSDTFMSTQVHFGMDFNVFNRLKLGVRSTFSKITGDIHYRDTYTTHPMNLLNSHSPPFSLNETFSRISNWRTMLLIKWGI